MSTPSHAALRLHLTFVVPIYNRKGYLLELVKRFSQIRHDLLGTEIDFVFVDDGSDREIFYEGDLPDVLRACTRIFRLPHFGRPARARNYGAEEAVCATHLLFMDSDDLIVAAEFERAWKIIKKSPAAVFPINFSFVNETGAPKMMYGRFVKFRWFDVRPYFWSLFGYRQALLKANQVINGSIIGREAFLKLGGYNENVSVEDYDLWLRAAFSGLKFRYVPPVFYQNRIHDTSRSFDKAKEVLDVLKFLQDEKLKGVMGRSVTKMQKIWQKKLASITEVRR